MSKHDGPEFDRQEYEHLGDDQRYKVSPPRPLINIDFGTLPTLPGFVWYFILAIAGLWAGWFVYVAGLFPAYAFPLEVLFWTLGTVFYVLGLVKLPVWWGFRVWILAATLMGVAVVIHKYVPSLDVGTPLLVIGIVGGMLGWLTLLWQYLDS